MATPNQTTEPWMSGTLAGLHPLVAAILYSFQHARLDLGAWTKNLSDAQLSLSELGLAPVSFHIRHIAGSVDRLLTYARGEQLSPLQIAAIKGEAESGLGRGELLKLIDDSFGRAEVVLRSLDPACLGETREIGRKRIPVPLGTLLVHIAEHTQRHVGEAIITAKVMLSPR